MAIKIIPEISDGTPEWAAAKELYDLFLSEWGVSKDPEDRSKTVTIMASARFQSGVTLTQDVDILVVYNSAEQGAIQVPSEDGDKEIRVLSFILAIEHKRHSGEDLRISEAGVVKVRYRGSGFEDATRQNKNQVYAVKGFLELFPDLVEKGTPWIDSIVWLANESQERIDKLRVSHNIVGSSPSLEKIVQTISRDKSRFPERRKNHRDRIWDLKSSADNVLFIRLMKKLSSFKTGTELDKKRMNILMEGISGGEIKGGLRIFRGFGGSGKTFGLLRTAIRSYQIDRDRVLFLTFNRMLVYEIRRLLAQSAVRANNAGGPRVQVESISAWIHRLAERFSLLSEGKNVTDLGPDEYSQLCDKLAAKIKERAVGNPESDVADLLDFDLACIDEAQDVPLHEKKTIETAFSNRKIIVADGIDQIVRIGGYAVDWQRDNRDQDQVVKLQLCYRMKKNLVQFANAMAPRLGMPETWGLAEAPDAIGGRVIICLGGDRSALKEVLMEEFAPIAGQIDYGDMLICMSAHLLRRKPRVNHVENDLIEIKMPYWDGTNREVVELPPMESGKVRLVSLDQCRGLEGWKVALVGLDAFYEKKLQEAEREIRHEKRIATPEIAAEMDVSQMAKISAAQWIMMILTRPIDTLIIHVEDEQSAFGQLLLEVAEMPGMRDYVWLRS